MTTVLKRKKKIPIVRVMESINYSRIVVNSLCWWSWCSREIELTPWVPTTFFFSLMQTRVSHIPTTDLMSPEKHEIEIFHSNQSIRKLPAKPRSCHSPFFKITKKTIKCLKWEGDCRQSLLVSSTNEVNSSNTWQFCCVFHPISPS